MVCRGVERGECFGAGGDVEEKHRGGEEWLELKDVHLMGI